MATIQDVFSHIYTTEAHLGDVAVKNGQIILCTDSEKLYIDHGTTRVGVADIVQVENQEALPLAPLDKLYITKDTGDIFFYINGVWKNLTTVISNYTAFEVYATDTEIAAGSVDDVTGLTYTEAVPAGMTHHFALRTDVAVAKAAEADVVVDWGDGVRETFADAYGVDTQDWESDREVTYRMRHTYAAPGRYIVTISGKDYWNFCSPVEDAGSGEYILSRVFDVDLPVASCVTNLTMACRWAQKLLRVRIPTGLDLFANRHNAAFLFKACRNLVEAIGMKTKFRYARDVANMFEDCDNLTTTDFELPVEVLKPTGYQHVFFGCGKLAVDINTLLPKTGFANRKVDLSGTFYNCAALTGTVPADILWKDSSKLWSVEAAFDGCSDAIRAQVPTSWGGTSTDEIISDLPVAKLSLNGTLPNTANGLLMLNASGKVDSSLLPEQAAINIDNYTSNNTIKLTSTAGAVNLISNTTEAAMYSGTAHVKANVDSVELQGTNLKFNSNVQNTAGGVVVLDGNGKIPTTLYDQAEGGLTSVNTGNAINTGLTGDGTANSPISLNLSNYGTGNAISLTSAGGFTFKIGTVTVMTLNTDANAHFATHTYLAENPEANVYFHGNATNTANGLVVLGADGKIPTNLYDATIDLSDYQTNGPIKLTTTSNAGDGSGDITITTSENIILKGGVYDKIEIGNATMHITSEAAVLINGQSGFVFQRNGTDVISESSGHLTLADDDININGNLRYNGASINTSNGLVQLDETGKIPASVVPETAGSVDLSAYNGRVGITTTGASAISNGASGEYKFTLGTNSNGVILTEDGSTKSITVRSIKKIYLDGGEISITGYPFKIHSNGKLELSSSQGNIILNAQDSVDANIEMHGTGILWNGAALNTAEGLVQLGADGKVPSSLLPEMTQSWTKVTINQSSFATSDDTYGGSYYELTGICSVEVYDAAGYKVEFDVKCDFTNNKTRVYIPSGLAADTISNWTLLYLAKTIA